MVFLKLTFQIISEPNNSETILIKTRGKQSTAIFHKKVWCTETGKYLCMVI